jgi:dephospho-CoA kinase
VAVVAGLTGGYGSGKSTVLQMFQAHDWFTMSADEICRELYDANDSRLIKAMTKRWGRKILKRKTDIINRSAVADIVFNDEDELAFLNNLLHPLVQERFMDELEQHRDRNIIFEVPLLYEVEWTEVFDFIIAVWCPKDKTLENLAARNITPDDFTRRSKNQLSPDIKLERADFGLINSGDIELLKKQVSILNNQLMKGKNNA